MTIRIDPGLPEAPFEQLKERITELVGSGELAPGDKLPTVRGLADELGLAPNTVARAYRELEAAGLLDTRGRQGTFVSGAGRGRASREAATAYVERMRALGVSRSESLDHVARAWDVRHD